MKRVKFFNSLWNKFVKIRSVSFSSSLSGSQINSSLNSPVLNSPVLNSPVLNSPVLNSPWGSGDMGPKNGAAGNYKNKGLYDIEDIIEKGKSKFKQSFGGGGSSGGGNGLSKKAIFIFALAGILLWLFSGFYTVQTNEVGFNMLFGKYVGKTSAGLNYNFPYPIGQIIKLKVTDRNSIDIGSRNASQVGYFSSSDKTTMVAVPEESLMLTGDENIADVKFRVIWQINPLLPEDFAFNLRNPEGNIKAVSESVMREIVGNTPIQRILTAERKIIEQKAQTTIQNVLDEYQAGVMILQIQLLSVDPPEQVIDAFRDVTAAQQDMQRFRNEAEAYANRIIPEARGYAARLINEAQAYSKQIVAKAMGEVSRYNEIYEEYKNSPYVTKKRMFIEMMEQVLSNTNKVIIDSKANNVVPYLPLKELSNK